MERMMGIEPTSLAWKARVITIIRHSRLKMVGKTGFEPATSWSQTRRYTKLSYFPNKKNKKIKKWHTQEDSNP